MSALKVLALRADDGGCAHYRIVEPARAVSEAYPEIEVTVDTGIDVVATKNSRTLMTHVSEVQTDADVIVIQRPLNQYFTALIHQAKKQGIACVVELDDDFGSVHPRNIAWRDVQPEEQRHINHEWVTSACDIADHVTVSTPALLKYAPHGRASVIPNYIPKRNITTGEIPAHTGPVRIGWSGSMQTHPTDLQVVGSGVHQAVRDAGASVSVVGDGDGVRQALGLARSTPFRATGWVPVDRYMDTLRASAEIGIVPLDDIPFNHAKSNLKGLEYAACGIPFIASPLPEYRALASNGIGILARDRSVWRSQIALWARNDDVRTEAAEMYRDRVRALYTLEDHAHQWVEAWSKALAER